MRPNNRQRQRGRNGGGGGFNKQHHNNNPNRPPNRNQLYDSNGPDVRVRGNAHQVYDKYQALAREAASSGERILSEAYWQYADHYFRLIQASGGFVRTNNWGEEVQPPPGQGPGQPGAPGNGGNGAHPQNGHVERQGGASRPPMDEVEPGLGGVAFLQGGRAPVDADPADDEQPEVPEFSPGARGRG